jgi:cellulose-binding protein
MNPWVQAVLFVVAAGSGARSAAPVQGGPDTTVASKPRAVVTTDPELDDANSLIRYLLYSTDFRTKGLIYASSGYHWKGDGTGLARYQRVIIDVR